MGRQTRKQKLEKNREGKTEPDRITNKETKTDEETRY